MFKKCFSQNLMNPLHFFILIAQGGYKKVTRLPQRDQLVFMAVVEAFETW